MQQTPYTSTKIVYSTSYDPWFNLALEEFLLTQVKSDEVILYLWQNHHTVVIGRNQNAWKECAWEQLEKDGGKLARRSSGGGAVFHDLGNLNFTFLTGQGRYDLEKQLSVILHALKALNIDAEFSGRNDLLIDGKKFSGHAYHFRQQGALHHGTIMVKADLESLSTYLKPSQKKIQSKGVQSVRSRVINLTEINPDITISQVTSSLQESFAEIYQKPDAFLTYCEKDKEKFPEIYHKYASWEWRFGESPRFDLTFYERFPWGEVEFCFHLKNGIIQSCVLYSDAMDEALIQTIGQTFTGLPLNRQDLIDALALLKDAGNAQMIQDISSYLSQEQSL